MVGVLITKHLRKMKVIQNTDNNQFEIKTDEHLAVLQYKLHRGTMYIMRTKVPEALSGQGIASQLAETALEYAKSEELPILIYCPFVRDYVEKNPQYKSLVTEKPA